MSELTKNRAALLRLFFTNPGQSYYMNEIGRILDKKPGFFQRTLNKMVVEGILISESRANARYFRVNREYPLYKELKSIVFKTVGIHGSIRKILQKINKTQCAFIYGSYASGTESSLSDIDLMVIGNIDEDNLIKELDKLERVLRREVNYKLYTVNEFRKAIKRKDPFLLGILDDKKIMLLGDKNELRKIYQE